MKSTGIIDRTLEEGKSGTLIEDETNVTLDFINPSIRGVNSGEHFAFMKIGQHNPEKEKVINILTKKIPN